MNAVFVELPAFARYRAEYLDEAGFQALQDELMADPQAGDVIKGTGGLRKVRQADTRRGNGKRGGLRIIYYWWLAGAQFWLFTLYDKDEAAHLTPKHRALLTQLLKAELEARN